MAHPEITGVHHVTALAKSPRDNHDFYTRVLGLRFIKRTVNHDDPMTYHLYYADTIGSPGSVLTHFPHPQAARSTHGTNEIRRTVLAVGRGALDFWKDRLERLGIVASTSERFGRVRLEFADPDGMELGIVEDDVDGVGEPWEGPGVPAAHAIRTVDTVTLRVADAEETARFLTETLGFTPGPEDGDRRLLILGDGAAGQRLELIGDASGSQQPMGAGTVHHVAWRVPDGDAQRAVMESLEHANTATTGVIDRLYFQSIYFRVPGRVIFEIATDGPGFTVDEPLEELGSALRLPPWHEGQRGRIEARLEPLGD